MEELLKKMLDLVTSMRGRTSMTHDQVKYLFSLYNEYYKTYESNYSCDLCVIRIYSKVEKIAMSYKKTLEQKQEQKPKQDNPNATVLKPEIKNKDKDGKG